MQRQKRLKGIPALIDCMPDEAERAVGRLPANELTYNVQPREDAKRIRKYINVPYQRAISMCPGFKPEGPML